MSGSKKITKYSAEKVLGLEGRYDEGELNSRYRSLVLKYHPDLAVRNGVDEATANEKMTEINGAYGLLRSLFAGGGLSSVECSDCDESDTAEVVSGSACDGFDVDFYDDGFQEIFDEMCDEMRVDREKREKENARINEVFERRRAVQVPPKWYLLLERVFELDVLWRVVFAVVCFWGLMNDTSFNVSRLFWSLAFLVSFFNLFVPFITGPLRKLASFVLEGLEPFVAVAWNKCVSAMRSRL